MRKVSIGASIGWIGESFHTLRKQPFEFLVMGFIFTGISLLPLGGVFIMLLGPALLGGMIYAARESAHGNKPKIGQLFQAFQEQSRTGSFIALCLPMVAAYLIAILFALPIIISIVHSGQISLHTLKDSTALLAAWQSILVDRMGRLLLLFVLFIVLAFVSSMLTFFAAAAVMLNRQPAFPAMRASFTACTRNFGAYFITILLLRLGVGILFMILHRFVPIFTATLLSGIPYHAILGPLTYTAYRSVFDNTGAVQHESDTPTTTRPPSQTFEA